MISETGPSVLPNAPCRYPSWVTAAAVNSSIYLAGIPLPLGGRPSAVGGEAGTDLIDESNNPLLPGLGLGQQEAVIACNYKFITVIVTNVRDC